ERRALPCLRPNQQPVSSSGGMTDIARDRNLTAPLRTKTVNTFDTPLTVPRHVKTDCSGLHRPHHLYNLGPIQCPLDIFYRILRQRAKFADQLGIQLAYVRDRCIRVMPWPSNSEALRR